MYYLGGKTRIAKEILPIILADRKDGQYFVEPFCGGCNVTAKVSGNRIANDYNEYLIAMFVGLLSGEKYPEQIGPELYNDVKSCFRAGSDKYDLGFMGWVGLGLWLLTGANSLAATPAQSWGVMARIRTK